MTVAIAKMMKMVPAAAPPRLAATGSDRLTMITKKSCNPAMISPTASHTSVSEVVQDANESLGRALDRFLDGRAVE